MWLKGAQVSDFLQCSKSSTRRSQIIITLAISSLRCCQLEPLWICAAVIAERPKEHFCCRSCCCNLCCCCCNLCCRCCCWLRVKCLWHSSRAGGVLIAWTAQAPSAASGQWPVATLRMSNASINNLQRCCRRRCRIIIACT